MSIASTFPARHGRPSDRAEKPPRWTRRTAVLAMALFGIVTSGVVLKVGGFAFSIERTFGLILLPVMLHRLLMPNGFPAARQLVWVWLSWGVVLTISAVFSGDFVAHLPTLLIALVPIAYFSFVTGARIDGTAVNTIVRKLVWLMGGVGTLALAASRAVGPAGVPFELVDEFGRLKLTVLEPNLYGSTLAFLMLVALPRAKPDWRTLLMFLLALVALVGSFSKAPLGGFVLGVVVFALLRSVATRSSASFTTILTLWISGLVGAIILFVLPSATKFYGESFARADAIFARSYLQQIAINRFFEKPIIGRGPGDFGLQKLSILRYIGGQDDKGNLWISQMMVNIIHDSGIIGIIIYIAFLVMVLSRGYQWVRQGSLDHCGYLAAFISVLIASQASTVHLSAIFGIAAGLVACTPLILNSKTRRISHTPTVAAGGDILKA